MVGCLICMVMLYRQFKQFVNICAGSTGYLVEISLNVLWIAMSSTRKLVCRPGSFFEICMSALVELYIP